MGAGTGASVTIGSGAGAATGSGAGDCAPLSDGVAMTEVGVVGKSPRPW